MKRVFIICIFLLRAISCGQAQNLDRQLTLDEALHITLTTNPAIKATANEKQAATQLRRAAIGLRMPQFNVVGSYTHLSKDIGVNLNNLKVPIRQTAQQLLPLIPETLQPSITGLLGSITSADWFFKIQDRNLGFIGGEMQIPLWLGGKINVANRTARINEQIAKQHQILIRNTLITELIQRYFGLSLALEVIKVRAQVVAGIRQHLKDAEALERNGMIAHSERLYVEFKLSEAERELSDTQLQLSTLTAALNNTLGSNNVSWRPITHMFLLDRIEEVAYFQDLAHSRNPQLRQVSYKQNLAEEGVRLRRADFMPQIAILGGGSFYNYQVAGIVPRWAIGIGVSIKLFDGLNREYNYSAAKYTVRRIAELQRKAVNDISVAVEQSYNQLSGYRQQIIALNTSLSFAEEYLRSKRTAFLEGLCSSSELIDAELELASVRAKRLQAAYDYDLALAQLLEIAGISEEFFSYMRRIDAFPVLFNQSQNQQ